ncbi:hypothetical protein [Clavibacter michiganensis]|uniref:hypothetical protein n=1 Tax=Clavibacter michiganensis TaxID=28447 RepID=UPI0037435DB3
MDGEDEPEPEDAGPEGVLGVTVPEPWPTVPEPEEPDESDEPLDEDDEESEDEDDDESPDFADDDPDGDRDRLAASSVRESLR